MEREKEETETKKWMDKQTMSYREDVQWSKECIKKEENKKITKPSYINEI